MKVVLLVILAQVAYTAYGTTEPQTFEKITGDLEELVTVLQQQNQEIRQLLEEPLQSITYHNLARQGFMRSYPNVVDKHGNTPLHRAAFHGGLDDVKILLDNGANINKANQGGDTPLHFATLYNHPEIADLLLSKGANIGAIGNFGVTPIESVVISQAYNRNEAERIDMMNIIIKHRKSSLDVKSFDKLLNDNGTALHEATELGKLDVMKVLLDAGANVTAQTDRLFNSPLHVAAIQNNVPAYKLLLQYNASTTLKNFVDKTPPELLGSDIDKLLEGGF